MAETIGPDQQPKWADSPFPTPTYGPGGRASIICSTAINAAPATCVALMLDPSTYPSWNRWIPRATVQAPSSPSSSSSSSFPPSTPASLLARFSSEEGQGQGRKPSELLLLDTRFQFEVRMDPDGSSSRGQKTDLVVTVLEEFERAGGDDGGGGGGPRKGLRVSWKTQGDHWYLKAERTQEFLERDGGRGTDYVCYETFFGLVAPIVKGCAGSALLKGFGLWMDGLKKAAEEKEKAKG